MQINAVHAPTIFVILGATGDLMKKKIIPALVHLYEKQKLPPLFHLIGFSRRPYASDDFREYVKSIAPNVTDQFLRLVTYQRGQLEREEDYTALSRVLGRMDGAWKACSNKLFYLAVPPPMYEPILKNLAASGLTIPCSPEEGWTRVLIEKPFGKDLKTSEMLDMHLASLFKEEQIYRIDHYLGKDMLQNILQFRFSNHLFEDSWNSLSIEKVEIRLLEKLGAEGRGAFYDGVGALRDVGQNHLLQMLALVAMDHPESFAASAIRAKRASALALLQPLAPEEVKKQSLRAQYDGYRGVEGVAADSDTETYFKIRASLSGQRWQGVPFILESGKRMGVAQKEIVVTFRHPTPCLCPPGTHYQNTITFRLEPHEEIVVTLFAKKPGLQNSIEERTIRFNYREHEAQVQYVAAYEKLLFDAIAGDQTLFASSQEVSAMWKFTDPIIEAWRTNVVPLTSYPPDTADIRSAGAYVEQASASQKNKTIGMIGLGKMGGGIAQHLVEKGWEIFGYNRTESVTRTLEASGIHGAYSVAALVRSLPTPRIIWLMLPAGIVVDEMLEVLIPLLSKDDMIIDGGNSFYKDTIRRNTLLTSHAIRYLDVGVSGGPDGARNGACLMAGGKKKDYETIEPLLAAIAAPSAYGYVGKIGAGHFVKMVHNGIEYGMMQAIAEGFTILKKANYTLNLAHVADVYNHKSVIESRLVGWLKNAFELHGEKLEEVSGSVGQTGEGAWTVSTARELKVAARVIEDALTFRLQSQKHPDFTGKVLSSLREQFGKHKA
ncbi:glucose-6-phosphate dehydrogenase [Candidatus Gottesmanbacteria bacterium]|nr:glucose-6-phosphate dehydrogenase [Candidatus Gottesmanbacteria bacterium]